MHIMHSNTVPARIMHSMYTHTRVHVILASMCSYMVLASSMHTNN